jgi:hypothetical protein
MVKRTCFSGLPICRLQSSACCMMISQEHCSCKSTSDVKQRRARLAKSGRCGTMSTSVCFGLVDPRRYRIILPSQMMFGSRGALLRPRLSSHMLDQGRGALYLPGKVRSYGKEQNRAIKESLDISSLSMDLTIHRIYSC